jgi:Surface antigen variable number repeat
MRSRVVAQSPILLLVCVCLCPTNARAQTSSNSGSCPGAIVSDDDFNEMTGRKVFPRVLIDDITFDRPIHLPTPAFDEFVSSVKQKRYGGSEWLDEIEESARGVWQDQGYFKARVTGQAIPLGGDADHQHFSVTIHVDEGPQYRLGSIRFRRILGADERRDSSPDAGTRHPNPGKDGESVLTGPAAALIFPKEALRKLVPLEDGDILKVAKIREGLDAMKDLYGTLGYIDFVPMPEIDVDDKRQIVSICFDLDEQMQFRIGKIEVVGLDAKTEKALIWKIEPGLVFNSKLFEMFFKDNQSVLPAGASSANNAKVRRNMKDGTVDIELVFGLCPPG